MIISFHHVCSVHHFCDSATNSIAHFTALAGRICASTHSMRLQDVADSLDSLDLIALEFVNER